MCIGLVEQVDDATARCLSIAKKYERDKENLRLKKMALAREKKNAEDKMIAAQKKEHEAIAAAAADASLLVPRALN